MKTLRTQVGVVGAGPAGLVLSRLLHRAGVETVVLERRSRSYCEQRVRAGVLEHGTVETLCEAGAGDRLRREGLVHRGVNLRFECSNHRIDLHRLTNGCTVTVYGQTEVVKDLIAAHDADGQPILFEAEDVVLEDPDSETPAIRFRHDGGESLLRCDYIAGCDGFHGVCRPSIPAARLTTFDHEYPFAWLGILADVPPSADEIVYANHERGFALLSMRSPTLSRLYIQCDPRDDPAAWSDDCIWAELDARLATGDGWQLRTGPVLEKSLTPMRSFVAQPMQYGRLFLAGDAAHIVPPTGAKGLNLAVADVRHLAEALVERYRSGRGDKLAAYSATCLRRVWRSQHFSWWMTSMLHRDSKADAFSRELQLAQLRYVCSSEAAAKSLAENYVGIV